MAKKYTKPAVTTIKTTPAGTKKTGASVLCICKGGIPHTTKSHVVAM